MKAAKSNLQITSSRADQARFGPMAEPSWPRRMRPLALASLSLLVLGLVNRAAAATDIWNNGGNAWETGSDWSTGNVPGAGDIASFDPTVANPAGVIFNPTITGADSALALNLDNNYLGGTYSFSGTGTLTIGTGGITTRGFGTQTISDTTLKGAATGNLTFNIGTDSGLTLAGAATAATNAGAVSIYGGTLTLDNSTTNTSGRLSTASSVIMNGGTFSVLGNSGGTTLNVGAFNVSASATVPGEGMDTISLNQPGTAATVLNFANTGTTSLRTTTGLVYNFTSNGTLGTATDQIKFGTATIDVNNGTISNGSTNTVGFAIVTDASGVNFANYSTNGVVAATTTAATAASSLTSATTNYSYSDALGADTAASVVANSIKIVPSAMNSSLTLSATGSTASTAALQTQALMLNDATNNDTFSLNGSTSYLVGNATKYIYITNPTTTLATNLIFFSGTNPVDIVGPGFVALTGTGSQISTNVAGNKINLIGGTLRASNAELNFATNSTSYGVIGFRGGVLEINGGTDGTGSGADFTRTISATNTAGYVNWESTTSGDNTGGSGGFSAYNSAASVNIGGLATPQTLTWAVASSGFVQDGYALIFGSTKSNARLDFLNPLALDGGTAGTYAAREIKVIGGAGGDSTNLAGVISGSASTDLIKSGAGTLTLSATNTFSGRTLIEGGTVSAAGTSGAALGTTAGVIINTSGILSMGATAQLGASVPVTLNGAAGAGNAAAFSVNGYSQGSTSTAGVGALTLAANSANNVIDFNNKNGVVSFAGFTPNGSLLTINNYADNGGASGGPDELIFDQNESANLGNIAFTGYGASSEAALGGGFYEVYPGLAAVPEPATIFGGLLMVASLGWSQRRRLSGFAPVTPDRARL